MDIEADDRPEGRRERNKRLMRERLADAAAALIAERGYDAVAMSDVAAAAGVAEQTLYNYFPTKPDLVLDRADDELARSRQHVAERDPSVTPAEALRGDVHADIDRFSSREPSAARGEFPAQSVASDALRRSALQFRHRQAAAIADAIGETNPEIPRLIALGHASVLVTVIQTVTDTIGAALLAGNDLTPVVDRLHADTDAALLDAAANFRASKARLNQNADS